MSQPLRPLFLCVLFFILLFFLRFDILKSLNTSIRDTFVRRPSTVAEHLFDYSKEYLDFGQYVPHWTFSKEELDLEHRRLIIVGDIHGMKTSLDKLLDTLSYAPSDLLIHLGDTIVKGNDTASILKQFTDANVTGVRGNHEQKIIEWRGWIEWIESQEGGKQWLDRMERYKGHEVYVWDKKHKHEDGKWRIPKSWKFMGKHYKIARLLTSQQYSYLKSLPLVIHLPSLHTHLVHAGILPFDPRISPTSSGQPLAHVPKSKSPPPEGQTRTMQEVALLTDIDQNTDPWVLLNMRSILDNDELSNNAKKGTPWSDVWDATMKRCRGYNQADVDSSDISTVKSRLSCLPINVVYGHAASRGLDVKRWSFGLDTGCVYGRNLTAMVISNINSFMDFTVEEQSRIIPFGEHGSARLVSIPCS